MLGRMHVGEPQVNHCSLISVSVLHLFKYNTRKLFQVLKVTVTSVHQCYDIDMRNKSSALIKMQMRDII